MDIGYNLDSSFTPTLYFQLQQLARRYMRRERTNHTYQPTALLNEALSRLLSAPSRFENRQHFFATCARQMRHILVNHAIAKRCAKRGKPEQLSTDEVDALTCRDESESVVSIVELDSLLTRFEEIDSAAARVFELCYFAGLTLDEAADVLAVSESTISRRLRFARAWFHSRLSTDLQPV